MNLTRPTQAMEPRRLSVLDGRLAEGAVKKRPAKGHSLVLLLSLMPMAGCYSLFPLDASPQLQVDEKVLGTWRCIPFGADETETATVVLQHDRGPARTYALTWQESGQEAESYEAFASLVAGKTVLNVRERGKGGAEWAFLRYAFLRQNLVHVEMAGYKLFEGAESSPAAARTALKHGGVSSFEDFSVCVRTQTPDK